MKIKDLVKNLYCNLINCSGEENVLSLTINSKECVNGSLFFCIKGNTTDGHKFAEMCVNKGAVAVVCDGEINADIPQIRVKNVRKALNQICKDFYGNPQKKLRTIAVVGTNGKTTVCESVCEVLNGANIPCGKIGTLGASYADYNLETGFTTPDSPTLYALLDNMVKKGMKAVCMEVSAHAIFYGKCDFKFDIAVLTNCTPEHLDFFGSYEKYSQVKAKAFTLRNCKLAVVNSDDALGLQIMATRKGGVISYGMINPSDVFAIDVTQDRFGTSFIINLFDMLYEVNSNKLGVFNVYNLLATATVCSLCGVKTDCVIEKLQNLKTVKGRMEKVCEKINVFVDYAHTPDGLENALLTLKKIKGNNKLICVFGCGGNRDKTKRAKMGEISGKYSDFTVITSDNPRFEEARDIIGQIEVGIRKQTYEYITVEDREKAIEYAVNLASLGDFILIAGKGAEEYQEYMGASRHFSDKEIACRYVLGKYDEL